MAHGLLADVHRLDQAVFQRVDVVDHTIEKDFTREFAHDLVNSDDDPARGIRCKRLWLDMRIDHAPLASPVGANPFVAVDHSALHAVWPDHIRLHRCQCAVEVAGVEGGIGTFEQFSTG